MQHPALRVVPLVVLAIACRTATEPTAAPEAVPFASDTLELAGAFTWRAATPESQGMCGSTRQLGCTKTLLQIWTDISNPKHNTKRFIVIRNDKVLFDRGGTLAYPGYSATKGLLGAPALVHAMNKCGMGLNDRVAQWLDHGDGARWGTTFPWTDITVDHLATHTSGVCDYSNKSLVCRNENAGWQAAY